jgi:hypothetical protein
MKLDALLKNLLVNEVVLNTSARCTDHSIDDLKLELQRSIATTKTQEQLHRMILQFEIDRCRKTFWHVTQKRNPNIMPKPTPLQCHLSNQTETIMQCQHFLNEMSEETKEMARTIDKLRKQRKHWDQAYKQYQIHNYHYIDCHGTVHENTMQYVDNNGRVHDEPMHFIDSNGTIYDQEESDNTDDDCTLSTPSQTLFTHGCYNDFLPRRKRPKVRRIAKYFAKR